MTKVEKRLFEYPAKLAEMEQLQGEAQAISSAHVSKLEAGKAEPGSPVEGWYVRLERIRARIAALSDETQPVERLLANLTPNMRELCELRYFKGIPWRKIWLTRNISRITVWRKRQKLLRIAGQYIREVVK